MEEVAAGAAQLVPPGDAEALTEGLRVVLDDADRASALSRQGPEVAAAYTWEASAAAHVALYAQVTGN
jgi:alpha-1,3-rhamnosyl/mannosyltransferase